MKIVLSSLLLATSLIASAQRPEPMKDVNQVIDNTPDSINIARTARPDGPVEFRRSKRQEFFIRQFGGKELPVFLRLYDNVIRIIVRQASLLGFRHPSGRCIIRYIY